MENFKNYVIATIAACSIPVIGLSCTPAQSKTSETRSKWQTDTLSTKQFIQLLSTASVKEINLSKLAKEKSKNSTVREYAVRLMDASILLYADLKPFAQARNITLADSTTFVTNQLISALKKASSNEFDKQYLSITTQDQNLAIALLEKGTKFGDTAIVNFSNKQLTVMRRTLEEAKFLSKQVSDKKITADKPRKEKMK